MPAAFRLTLSALSAAALVVVAAPVAPIANAACLCIEDRDVRGRRCGKRSAERKRGVSCASLRGGASAKWESEDEWTAANCPGDSQRRNADGTRADCLTNSAVVEVDFPEKWAEAHGQAVRYRRLHPGKSGEIWILCGKPGRGSCERHVPGLLRDAAETGVIVRCRDWATGGSVRCPH